MEEKRRRKIRRRHQVGKKLRQFKFFRVLDQDRAFAVAFVVLAAVAGLTGMAFLKLWRVSPDGYDGSVVRLSLIDWLQVRARTQAARQAEAAGDYAKALFSWRSAEALNQGDPALYRGLLEFLGRASDAPDEDGALVTVSLARLLELSRTNLADLQLGAGVLEKFGHPRAALEVLALAPEGANDALVGARARCLATAGDFAAFEPLWRAHAATWSTAAEWSRYRAAWQAVAGPAETRGAAATELRNHLASPGVAGISAARLLFEVGARMGELDWTRAALERLKQARADATSLHTRHWRLLAASGREKEARELAMAYADLPSDADEAAAYLQALRELAPKDARGSADPREQGVRFAEDQLIRYGRAPAVWQAYLELLIDLRRWNDVRRVTVKARTSTGQHEALLLEAVLADLRAALAAGRAKEAESFVQELEGIAVIPPAASVRAAVVLRGAGKAKQALALLQRHGALKDATADWAARARSLEAELRAELDPVATSTRVEPGAAAPAR